MLPIPNVIYNQTKYHQISNCYYFQINEEELPEPQIFYNYYYRNLKKANYDNIKNTNQWNKIGDHYYLNDQISFNAGVGYVQEGVKSNRYELNSDRRTNNINYVFAQTEIKPIEKITIIAGFRYDNNQLFAAAFSPKIAAMYKATEHLKFNASIGRGFKAPDFRQLYLNFTNTAAGGYSVFGALEAQKQIEFLQNIGQIFDINSQIHLEIYIRF